MPRKKSNNNNTPQEPTCGFCSRHQRDVGMMVEGKSPDHYICGPCARLSYEIFEREATLRAKKSFLFDKIPLPRQIVESLDQFIIGQSHAKKVLAVAVYSHYRRLMNNAEDTSDCPLEKSNLLLQGNSGIGKTLMVKILAKIINIPLAIGDATTLTEAGYVGDDVESLLLKLLHASNMDVDLAEKGIIYIDEIDKLAASRGNVNITRDVSGEGVQQGLLKMIEGTVASVPPHGGRKHPEQKCINIDTTNILFICGGTFIGLEDIASRREGKKRMGFATGDKEKSKDEIMQGLCSEDFIEFGLIPELVGRLPVVTHLHDLDEDMLVRVLTEPKNSLIKQYKKLFKIENSELEFTPESLREIAKIAKKEDTGARSLRGIVDKLMLDIMFTLPERSGDKYVITDAVVRGEEKLSQSA